MIYLQLSNNLALNHFITLIFPFVKGNFENDED
jgi:hypothetical protein